MTHTKYKIKTISDIYHKIPTDRIEVFMRELTQVFLIAGNTAGLMNEVSKSIIKEKTGKKIKGDIYKFAFPEIFEWIDDEKGNCELGLKLNNKHNIKTTWKNKEAN